MQSSRAPGRIFTFYSYKGGTGRSMLVANTGWLLATAGYHVLMVDWDLEAPGLHRYMAPFLTDPNMTDSNGLIDLVVSYATEAVEPAETPRPPQWIEDRADVLDYAVSINWKFQSGGTLSLLPAGRQGTAYATKVNSFSWQNFYDRLGGFNFFEALKQSMRTHFDFILVDSRTGVSDTAGICTVQFPDSLVVCFTLNNQSIEGAAAVARSVQQQKSGAEFRVFPVPTRLDNSESEKLLQRWQLAKDRFADLLPSNTRGERYWDELSVLYVPKFAYEEVLAVFGNRPDDPANLNLLAHAKRLTEMMAGVEVPLAPIDDIVRSNVLAHFAGRPVDLSPMEAQTKSDEEKARQEEERRRLETEQATKIAAARSEAKQEAQVVLAAELRRTRRQRIAMVAGLVLILLSILGYTLMEQRAESAVRAAVAAGDQARMEMRWNDAVTEYDKAIAAITDDPTLYARRADALVQLGNIDAAVADLNKAIEMNHEDLDLRATRGQILLNAGNHSAAIEDFTFVLGRRPEELGVMSLLADAYQKNSQLPEAIGVYSTLLDKYPGADDANNLLRRADLYVKTKDRESAIKDFRRVASLSPDSPSAVFAQAQLKAMGASPTAVVKPVPVRTVVYIQYSDETAEAVVPQLRTALSSAGFQAPEAQLRENRSAGEIRYFHREDADRANRVKKVVELELAQRRFLVTLALQPMDSKRYPEAPVGQIEVWLPPLQQGYGIQQRAVPRR